MHQRLSDVYLHSPVDGRDDPWYTEAQEDVNAVAARHVADSVVCSFFT